MSLSWRDKRLICTPEHRYYLIDEQDKIIYELDGITAILRSEGFMSNYIPEDLDWYLIRGTMIHHATALWDMDILDESTVDERIRGYLESWKKYRAGDPKKYSSDEVEIKLHDPVYRFAGTPDRMDLDIKSGAPERWHVFQIAAYRHLVQVNKLGIGPDRTVYLQDEGSEPKVKVYKPSELRRALETFLCALNVHRAKREMGV